MNFTIKIDHKEKEAEKIIQLIKEMVVHRPYVSIYEDETGLSNEKNRNWICGTMRY